MNNPENKKKEETTKTNDKISKTLGGFILKFLEDRASDPLWRSFAFFFIIYNWKAFAAFVLGDIENPSDRIEKILTYFHENKIPDLTVEIFKYFNIFTQSNYTLLGQAYWFIPFCYSMLFIFVYLKYIKPIVVEIYTNNNELSLKSAKKKLKLNKDKIKQLEIENNNIIKEKNDLLKEIENKKQSNAIYNVEYSNLYKAYIQSLKIKLGENKSYYILEFKDYPDLKLNAGGKYKQNGISYTVISVSMIGFLIEQD